MIHSAVNGLLTERSQPPLEPLLSAFGPRGLSEWPGGTGLADGHGPPHESDNTESQVVDEPSQHTNTAEPLSQVPINSLYQITRLSSLRSRELPTPPQRASIKRKMPRDLVSRGILSWANADKLVQAFLSQTDHYLYGTASNFTDLDSIRSASTLLLTAICTVSALHDPSAEELYRVCSAELRRLVSNFVFTSQVNLDDFRGMCIACFWLSDMAWPVSGLAIRRAFEFELQGSFQLVSESRSADGDGSQKTHPSSRSGALDCLRLWYLFYICDHHLSILYGRPSIFGDQQSVNEWETYYKSVPETSTDNRISSQIALLLILDKVSRLFGTNINVRIPTIFRAQLDDFNHQLDLWITTWLGRCGGFTILLSAIH